MKHNDLLHAILNQIEIDLNEQDYEALDEMLQLLIKNPDTAHILYNYLSDTTQAKIKELQ